MNGILGPNPVFDNGTMVPVFLDFHGRNVVHFPPRTDPFGPRRQHPGRPSCFWHLESVGLPAPRELGPSSRLPGREPRASSNSGPPPAVHRPRRPAPDLVL